MKTEHPDPPPTITTSQTFTLLSQAKLTKSSTPDELLPGLRKEFLPWLAEPVQKIIESIISSGEWPEQFRTEYGTPIEKVKPPVDEDDLRVISITSKISMVIEKLVIQWLWPYLEPLFDRDQFGGQTGNSIAHYLIELTNTILHNQDLNIPYCTLLTLVDYSKGYNRIDHNRVIRSLAEYNVPPWLIRIIAGYLKNRKLIVRFKGLQSLPQDLPGGAGQGTLLGMWIFLLSINLAGPSASQVPRSEIITQRQNKKEPIKQNKQKWVDDLSLEQAYNLRTMMEPIEEKDLIRPLNFHERTEMRIASVYDKMQDQINELQVHARDQNMQINEKKTVTMLFNSSLKYDFVPQIKLENGKILPNVEQTKILGYLLTSDLKSKSNTDYMIKRAYKKMWILRRLKSLGCPVPQLINVMKQHVYPMVELAVPFWNPLLTQSEIAQIERTHKVSLQIILGPLYTSYNEALISTNLISLQSRREIITSKFAQKCLQSSKFGSWFKSHPDKAINTRSKTPVLVPIQTRTSRYYWSALPNLTRIINSVQE